MRIVGFKKTSKKKVATNPCCYLPMEVHDVLACDYAG